MYNKNWYKSLKKAPWTPKPKVFGMVWSILYACMFIATYLVWKNKKCYPYCDALNYFFIQLFFNLIWTTIFFKFKKPVLALADMVIIIIGAYYTYVEYSNIDITAGYLIIPYILWLCVAFSLNAYIVAMN